MSLSHTFYVTADAKALFSILCSSGSIEIKMRRGPEASSPTPSPPSTYFSYIYLVNTSVSRGLNNRYNGLALGYYSKW